MMKIFSTLAAAGAAALIVAGGFAGASLAQSGSAMIKERQALMKNNGKDGKMIGAFVNKGHGSAAAAAAAAMKIASNAEKIPSLFPKGTGNDSAVGKKGKTRAKPMIWTHWAKFQADASTLKTRAEALAKAINGGQKKMMVAALKEMAHSCGACHKTFRAPEKR